MAFSGGRFSFWGAASFPLYAGPGGGILSGMAKPTKTCAVCKGAFLDDGPFLTCLSCRRPLSEEQKRNQTGCRFWNDVDADPRVRRAEQQHETF